MQQTSKQSFLKQDISNELIKKTINVWQPYCDYPLTQDDAREIIADMRHFAIAMIRLNSQQKTKKSELGFESKI